MTIDRTMLISLESTSPVYRASAGHGSPLNCFVYPAHSNARLETEREGEGKRTHTLFTGCVRVCVETHYVYAVWCGPCLVWQITVSTLVVVVYTGNENLLLIIVEQCDRRESDHYNRSIELPNNKLRRLSRDAIKQIIKIYSTGETKRPTVYSTWQQATLHTSWKFYAVILKEV